MNVDASLLFSDAQAVTGSSASTSVVDTLLAGDALADELYFVADVNTTATSGGASTVTIALQTSDDEAFGSYTTLLQTGAIAKASLVAGYNCIKTRVPSGALRYLRVYYTVATTNLDTGKFNALLTDGVTKTFAVQ